jgi:trehalose/maltose hydrolase-like predicted phosphorylase
MIGTIKIKNLKFKFKSTTLSNGYLGSRTDEERSEMRYVMRIAEFSESSNF